MPYQPHCIYQVQLAREEEEDTLRRIRSLLPTRGVVVRHFFSLAPQLWAFDCELAYDRMYRTALLIVALQGVQVVERFISKGILS